MPLGSLGSGQVPRILLRTDRHRMRCDDPWQPGVLSRAGKGFLRGTQSHLDYLPEGHTDFVFATMAEEWGLVGGVLLIFAFMLLLRWGNQVALRAEDKFSRLTAAGLAMTIFFYICVNLMMVMGLAPVVGIPLPFMSYGGSSMLTIMICIGIIMAIDRQKRGASQFG